MSTSDELRRIADILEAHPDVKADVGLVHGRAAIAAILDCGDPEIRDEGSYAALRIPGDVAVSVHLWGETRKLVLAERQVESTEWQPCTLDEIRGRIDATD